MDGPEGAQNSREKLLGLLKVHGFWKAPISDVEEFLHYLVADNAFPGCHGSTDQVIRSLGLVWGRLIERVDEDVGVKKESIVHSFRREYTGHWIEQCAGVASSGHRIPRPCLPVG